MTTTAQYEGIIKEMTSTYNTIIAELKILDKRAFDAEETVKTLRDRLKVRNDEIAQLKASIACRDEELCEMNNRVNERDNEIEELTGYSTKQAVEIDKLKNEISELATCPASCQDLRKRDMEIDDLKVKLEDAHNTIDALEKDKEFDRERHESRIDYVHQLEGENTQLEIKLQKIRELVDVKAD